MRVLFLRWSSGIELVAREVERVAFALRRETSFLFLPRSFSFCTNFFGILALTRHGSLAFTSFSRVSFSPTHFRIPVALAVSLVGNFNSHSGKQGLQAVYCGLHE